MFVLNPRVHGVTQEMLKAYDGVCPSTIGHMTDFGFIRGLEPIFRPIRFMGNAVTVKIPHMDSTAVHKVMDTIEPGDIICVDMSGDTERSCWGEMVSYMARAKKAGGAVVGGCVTDYNAIREIGVPIFSYGVSALTTRILGVEGAINVPISIRNVPINPGDLIVADDDGVFVISPKDAMTYPERAVNAQNAEIGTKRKIDGGASLAELSGAAKYFA